MIPLWHYVYKDDTKVSAVNFKRNLNTFLRFRTKLIKLLNKSNYMANNYPKHILEAASYYYVAFNPAMKFCNCILKETALMYNVKVRGQSGKRRITSFS